MAKTSTSSSRNLPIWEVSEFAWRIAQEQDMAKTSTSLPRNLPIWGVSKSAWQTAQAQDQDEDVAKTSRNLPIWEVSESALQKSQVQARDSSMNADAPVWEMARTSPPRPLKFGIYLLECPRGGADVLTLLGPASLIASAREDFERTHQSSWCNSSAPTEKPHWRIWPSLRLRRKSPAGKPRSRFHARKVISLCSRSIYTRSGTIDPLIWPEFRSTAGIVILVAHMTQIGYLTLKWEFVQFCCSRPEND
jgi:hypothetical protein